MNRTLLQLSLCDIGHALEWRMEREKINRRRLGIQFPKKWIGLAGRTGKPVTQHFNRFGFLFGSFLL